jgi:ATPase subunit of ABC transporter with duplicated ATPase domains
MKFDPPKRMECLSVITERLGMQAGFPQAVDKKRTRRRQGAKVREGRGAENYTCGEPLSMPMVDGENAPVAVELERVSRLFGNFVALREVSLALPVGASVVLLGENGAGNRRC